MPLPMFLVQFYVPHRYLYNVICSCKTLRNDVLGNKEYWNRVAAHSLWRRIHIEFHDLCKYKFDYTEYFMVFVDNYNDAMEQFWNKLAETEKTYGHEITVNIRDRLQKMTQLSNKERILSYFGTITECDGWFDRKTFIHWSRESNALHLLKQDHAEWKARVVPTTPLRIFECNFDVAYSLTCLLHQYDRYNVDNKTKRAMFEAFAAALAGTLVENADSDNTHKLFSMARMLRGILNGDVSEYGIF